MALQGKVSKRRCTEGSRKSHLLFLSKSNRKGGGLSLTQGLQKRPPRLREEERLILGRALKKIQTEQTKHGTNLGKEKDWTQERK